MQTDACLMINFSFTSGVQSEEWEFGSSPKGPKSPPATFPKQETPTLLREGGAMLGNCDIMCASLPQSPSQAGTSYPNCSPTNHMPLRLTDFGGSAQSMTHNAILMNSKSIEFKGTYTKVNGVRVAAQVCIQLTINITLYFKDCDDFKHKNIQQLCGRGDEEENCPLPSG